MKRFKNCGKLLAATAVVLGFGLASNAVAYFGAPGKQVPVTKSMNSSPYGYYEYLPPGYSESSGAKYPVILFLHGLGEEGNGESDLGRNLANGPPRMANNGTQFPAIVVSPQSPVWWNSATVDQFVNYVYSTYKAADPSRLYVTGLSMGGGGTWDYAASHPNKVAAIVPICGASDGSAVPALMGKGVWAFHDFDDGTVGFYNTVHNIDHIATTEGSIMNGYPYGANNSAASSDMIAVYSQSRNTHTWSVGNTVNSSDHDTSIRFTAYQYGGHDAWDRAYANQDMWNWLYTWTNNAAPVPTPAPPVSTPVPTPVPTVAPTPVPQNTFNTGSVSIDLGAGNSSGINNLSDARSGNLTRLLNQNQQQTSANLRVTVPFNSTNTNGTTSPASPLGIPGSASADSFFGNDRDFTGVYPNAQLEVSGLDPATSYSLTFFASRMGAGGDNRETEYQAVGATSGIADLNVSENTSQVATVSGVKPDANGKILINVKKGPHNNNSYGFFYLGWMKIAAGGTASPPTATPTPVPSTPTPTPAPPKTIAVDFGANGPAIPAGWVNGRGLIYSGSVALSNTDGTATSISLATVSRFNEANTNGTTSPASSLNMPAECTEDSFYGNDKAFASGVFPKAVMELHGLDPSKTYTLEFFASRVTTENTSRETLYTAVGATTASAALEVVNNTSNIATVSVKPDANGVIQLQFMKGPHNTNSYGFYYIGNLRIKY